MTCKMFSTLLILLIFGLYDAFAQPVQLTLPDVAADAGEVVEIPVTVSEMTEADGVISGDWTFTSSRDIIQFQSVITAGTLLEGISVDFNRTTGKFAFANAQVISGEGTLIILQVQVNSDVQKLEQTDIGISDGQFNEGNTEIETVSGTLQVRGINITPKAPSGPLVEGETFQFNLSGTVTQPITWSSSADTVATVSDAGLVSGISPGSIRIFAEDAAGLRDSTNIFRVEPATLLDLSLTIPDLSVTQTLEGIVPLTISDISGLDIISGEFDLVFSSDKIEILALETGGTLLEGRPAPEAFEDGNRISVAFADSEPFEGEGVLLNIRFRVFREATGTATITPQNSQFNESFFADEQAGTVNIVAAPVIDVEPGELSITKNETKFFTVLSGGTAPYTWSSENENVASIDPATGELTALERGTTRIIATDSENFTSAGSLVTVNDVTVSVGSGDILDEEVIAVPVQTQDVTGLGIISYEIEIGYNTDVATFQGLELNGTLSDGLTVSAFDNEGTLRIAMGSANEMSGEGDLIRLLFSAADSAGTGDETPLSLQVMKFNEPGPDTPTATPVSGAVSVSKTVVPNQIILVSPENEAVGVSTGVTFLWQDDVNSTAYEFELAADSSFSTPLIQKPGLAETTFTPAVELDFETSYFWRVRGAKADTTGPWSEIRSFTTVAQGELAAPVLLTPENGADNVLLPVGFSWNSVPEATEYKLLVSETEDFAIAVTDSTLSDTVLTDTSLEEGKSYFWRVRGADADTTSSWSDIYSFTTGTQPPLDGPELLSPADKATELTSPITFTWNSVMEADKYTILISESTDFSVSKIDSTITETELTVSELKSGTNYFWKVIASDEARVTDSVTRSFTTKMDSVGVPKLISPANESAGIDTMVTLSWHIAESADSYHVELSNNVLFDSNVLVKEGADTTAIFGNLEFQTTYYWRVKELSEGVESEWSETWSFSTLRDVPGEVILISPENGAIDFKLNPTFSWQETPNGENYRLQLSLSPEFGVNDLKVDSSGIHNTQFTIQENLESVSDYYWRVSSSNESGSSKWSEIWSFTTQMTTSIQEDEIPGKSSLAQNYPNPFNPTTNISYELSEASDVRLVVVDLLGRKVASLVNERKPAGRYTAIFNASNLSSGTYIYRIEAGNFTQTRKLMLIK